MTEEQKEICMLFGSIRYPYGGFDKRFGNNLYFIALNKSDQELSDKQIEWMYRLLYKYRNQAPHIYNKHKSNPLCQKKS